MEAKASKHASKRGGEGTYLLPADDAQTYDTRVQPKIRSLADLGAARVRGGE